MAQLRLRIDIDGANSQDCLVLQILAARAAHLPRLQKVLGTQTLHGCGIGVAVIFRGPTSAVARPREASLRNLQPHRLKHRLHRDLLTAGLVHVRMSYPRVVILCGRLEDCGFCRGNQQQEDSDSVKNLMHCKQPAYTDLSTHKSKHNRTAAVPSR